MKTKELVYIVLDLCKNASDDAYYTEEHVEWLLNKNRSFLLKREQERLKQKSSELNEQTICVDLEPYNGLCDDCSDTYLRSAQKVPEIISNSTPQITTLDYFSGNISFVPYQKMRYVNYNKFLRNIIFAAIGPDNRVYLKSSNPVFENLTRIKISGVFDDYMEAASMSCDENGESDSCDTMEREFPIDTYLVPELVDRVLRELLGAQLRGQDKRNDANDSLSDIANYINRHLKRSDLKDSINGEQ